MKSATDTGAVIQWTARKRDRLQKAYDAAVREKSDSFTFDGHEFFTPYAGYLLQYLDGQLGGSTNE